MEENTDLSTRHVRMTWQVWPRTNKYDLIPLVVCLYPRGKETKELIEKPPFQKPDFCRRCSSVINCFQVPRSKVVKATTTCLFCSSGDRLPPTPSSKNRIIPYDDQTFVWKMSEISDIESKHPLFLFLVGNCNGSDEDAFKSLLKGVFASLPPEAMVGLISFGSKVQCGLDANEVFVPASRADIFLPIIQTDKESSSMLKQDAISKAISLVNEKFENFKTSSRITAFLNGPCTKDLQGVSNSEFYGNIGKELAKNGHVLDVYATSSCEGGVAEMKVAVEKSGGVIVLGSYDQFHNSLKRRFEDHIKKKHTEEEEKTKSPFEIFYKKNPTEEEKKKSEKCIYISLNSATLEIKCSKEIKVKEIMGPTHALEENKWKICGIDLKSCITILFDYSGHESNDSQLYLQFLTRYQNTDGQKMLRVTTVTREWDDQETKFAVEENIDVATAAVLFARQISSKMEMNDHFGAHQCLADAERDINDRTKNCGPVAKRNISRLIDTLFHLKQSRFVKVTPYSLDERAYFTSWLNRESISNSLLMFYPILRSNIRGKAGLSTSELTIQAFYDSYRILLLDTFFDLTIYLLKINLFKSIRSVLGPST